jgi:CheY-like chemotaxis protein
LHERDDLQSSSTVPARAAAPAAGLSFAATRAGRATESSPDRDSSLSSLLGVRVLVVEDEMMVALYIEDTLSELGCEVIEPAHTLGEAMARIDEHEVDAAVLDINIAEHEVYPVAERLASSGVPFIFATGYAPESIRENWRDHLIIRKPYHAEQLRSALEQALRQADR